MTLLKNKSLLLFFAEIYLGFKRYIRHHFKQKYLSAQGFFSRQPSPNGGAFREITSGRKIAPIPAIFYAEKRQSHFAIRHFFLTSSAPPRAVYAFLAIHLLILN